MEEEESFHRIRISHHIETAQSIVCSASAWCCGETSKTQREDLLLLPLVSLSAVERRAKRGWIRDMKMRHGKKRKSSPKCYMSERYNTYIFIFSFKRKKEREKKENATRECHIESLLNVYARLTQRQSIWLLLHFPLATSQMYRERVKKIKNKINGAEKMWPFFVKEAQLKESRPKRRWRTTLFYRTAQHWENLEEKVAQVKDNRTATQEYKRHSVYLHKERWM